MKTVSVLSIDWDYFFPNPTHYDWGAHEENPFLYQLAWAIRAGMWHHPTKQTAVEHFNPEPQRLNDFFKRNVASASKGLKIYIGESHAQMPPFLNQNFPGAVCDITNFDAHHDWFYNRKPRGMSYGCANWAAWLDMVDMLGNYRVVYPDWRKAEPEHKTWRGDRVEVLHYAEDLNLRLDIDALFICRSPCWTPSWADNAFYEFTSPQSFSAAFDRPWDSFVKHITVAMCEVIRTMEPPEAKAAAYASVRDVARLYASSSANQMQAHPAELKVWLEKREEWVRESGDTVRKKIVSKN